MEIGGLGRRVVGGGGGLKLSHFRPRKFIS